MSGIYNSIGEKFRYIKLNVLSTSRKADSRFYKTQDHDHQETLHCGTKFVLDNQWRSCRCTCPRRQEIQLLSATCHPEISKTKCARKILLWEKSMILPLFQDHPVYCGSKYPVSVNLSYCGNQKKKINMAKQKPYRFI